VERQTSAYSGRLQEGTTGLTATLTLSCVSRQVDLYWIWFDWSRCSNNCSAVRSTLSLRAHWPSRFDRAHFGSPCLSKGRSYAVERIKHIVGATDAISSYVRKGRAAFDGDSTVRDAILYQIIVIGEAAKAVVAADNTIEAEVPRSSGRCGQRCATELPTSIGRRITRLSGKPRRKTSPDCVRIF
jgi:hypothetical protein